MFDYMYVQDATKEWGIWLRKIQVLCSENRIGGAVQYGHVWTILTDAEKLANMQLWERG